MYHYWGLLFHLFLGVYFLGLGNRSPMDFLSWLRGQQTQLASMRTQVQSLASLSGLRIWRCHEVQCRSQMWLRSCVAMAVVQAGSWSSDLTPRLGTSICGGCGPKKDQNLIHFVILILFVQFSALNKIARTHTLTILTVLQSPEDTDGIYSMHLCC